MSNDEQLPTSVWTGTFRLFGVDVVCHVLSDGRRIIEAESMERFIQAMDNGLLEPGDLMDFKEWQRGD